MEEQSKHRGAMIIELHGFEMAQARKRPMLRSVEPHVAVGGRPPCRGWARCDRAAIRHRPHQRPYALAFTAEAVRPTRRSPRPSLAKT